MDHTTVATVLALTVALLATTVPPGTAEQPSLREENREWVRSYVDDYDPRAQATLHTGHGVETIDARDAMHELLDRLDTADAYLTELFQTPKDHGDTANHTAGDMWIVEVNSGAPDCNQHGSGDAGHYDHLVAETGRNGVVINHVYVGTWKYVGTATSAISTGEDGHAVVLPIVGVDTRLAEVPDQHFYQDVVRYEGNSDFWCLDFAGSTFNLPFVRGTFGPVAQPVR